MEEENINQEEELSLADKIKKKFGLKDIPTEEKKKTAVTPAVGNVYIAQKNANTLKRYQKPNGGLRKVSDELSRLFNLNPLASISYSEIADNLGMNEGSVKILINELATWKDWPLTIISSPKKKGEVQLYSKDFNETEGWILKNEKYVATKTQRLGKTTTALDTKQAKEMEEEKEEEKEEEPIKVKNEK